MGRHPDNDLLIADGRLSGFHCRIERSINAESGVMEVMLRDLSTNGTFKNGQMVSPLCFLVGNQYSVFIIQIGKGNVVPLKNGDEIHLLLEDASAGVTASEEIGMIFVVL